MGLLRLYRMMDKYSIRARKADEIFSRYIKTNNPALISVYDEWASIKRNINCPALTSLLGERLCELEKRVFDLNKRNVSFFAGAAGRISDDLIDDRIVSAEEVYFLGDNKKESKNSKQLLFYAFNDRTIELLPKDFMEKFSDIIKLYNDAQREGSCLSGDYDFQRIKEVKDKTGGYPILLLYNLMNPEERDLSVNFSPNYDSQNWTLPKTKGEAIFNLGVFMSRADDVYDKEFDMKQGIKSIATESDFGWKDVRREIKYIEAGLERFYPKESIKETIDDCKMMTGKMTLMLDKIAQRLRF